MRIKTSVRMNEHARRRHSVARHVAAREDGIALLLVVVMIAVFSLLGALGTKKAQTELQSSNQYVHSKQALSVAEAGANHVYSLIKAGGGAYTALLGSGGTGGAIASLGVAATKGGKSYRFVAFGGGASDGYYVRVDDNYDENATTDDPATDTDNQVYVTSLAIEGDAQRTVRALVGGTPLFSQGVFAKTFINLSGGSVSDSYDSTQGSYVAAAAHSHGDVRSNGTISLSGGSTIVKGDAKATGTVSASGGSTITGTSTQGAPPLTYASVVSCGPPYSSGTGITGSGSWSYNSTTGVLNGSGGATVILSDTPGTYCFHSVTMSGGSLLQVSGPVTINIASGTGVFNISGGSVSNTTSLAKNLIVNSSSTGQVTISGSSAAYMAIYAPDAPVVFSSGSSGFFGAVISLSVTRSGGGGMHYDESLAQLPGGNITIRSWQEVRNQ